MNKNKRPNEESTGKKDTNAGSAGFNQGAEQDPEYNKGTKVSDKEKRTQEADDNGKPQDERVGNIGMNNAGGYE
jgi:hypothetical protein